MAGSSWRVSTNRFATTYICPSCQHARSTVTNICTPILRSTSDYVSNLKNNQKSQTAGQRRLFNHSVKFRAIPHSTVQSSDEVAEYDFTFTAKKPSKSSIRESLKTWSEQNELDKILNAPIELSAEGRIKQLPNNLFLKNKNAEDIDTRDSHAFEDEIEGVETTFIKPGTLFSHATGADERELAIYLGSLGVQAMLVLESGRWSVERLPLVRNIDSGTKRAIVPDFLNHHEIEGLKVHLPTESITRPIGDGIGRQDVTVSGALDPMISDVYLRKIKVFQKEVEAFDRAHRAQLDAAFHKIAHDTEWRFIPLREYVQEAIGLDYAKLPSAARMAIINSLSGHDRVRVVSTAETITIMCCSKEMESNVQKVLGWAREYQDAAAQAALGKDVTTLLRNNPLTAFIDKSRRLILKSRKLRAPTTTGCLGPYSIPETESHITLKKVYSDEKFTAEDTLFIKFIWNATFRKPSTLWNGPWKTLPITSLILRAVGAYPSLELGTKVGRLFLKEIGAADPWVSRFTQDISLRLPGGRASHDTDRLNEEMMSFASEFRKRIDAGKLQEFDSMKHLRRNWGSLKAMAIDTPGAKIAEDAISVEPARDLPGGYWVHVHSSHPTAYLTPDNIVSKYSRHQGASCFTVDGSMPSGMVPAQIASFFHLCSGSGAPVMTMSTLMTEDGRVHQRKVSVGTLNNIIQLNRHAMDHVLDIDRNQDEKAILVVGKVSNVRLQPVKPLELEQAMEHKDDLRLLKKLVDARWSQRKLEMSEEIIVPRYNFESQIVTTNADRLFGFDREALSYHWHGDPGIVLSGNRIVTRSTSDDSRTGDVVTQAMRLAAETAGIWLAQRKIPAVFLSTQAVPDNSFEKLRNARPGTRILLPRYVRSSKPAPFYNINIQSYTLCTSPIRRYIDMIAHFQIDSYLKAESKGLVHSGSPVEDDSMLAFSKADIDDYLAADACSADKIEMSVRGGKLDYAFQAFFRAFHFHETKLPPLWEVMIDEPAKSDAAGRVYDAEGALIPFGLACTIKASPEGWERNVGYRQFIPVKILMVDPDEHKIFVEAVGPATDEQTMTDPIRLWTDANIDESIQLT